MSGDQCGQCGHVNAEGANFCSSCGSRMREPEDMRTKTLSQAAVPVDPSQDPEVEITGADVASIVVQRGPNAGSKYALDADTVTAGRHPDSEIFLDDITVSRRHAEVLRTPAGFAIRDVGSLNGTYVNRERIDEQVALRDGDEVQIGRYKLIFLAGS